jgi:DNA-binding IclR family transcriptional regulator
VSVKKDKDEDRYNIRAIERALTVLEVFSADRTKLSLDQLTEASGLSKPTVFRILSTLQSRKYVILDKEDGRYRLGSIFLSLASAALSSLDLAAIARPHLTELRNLSQATVLLGALMDDLLVYLDKIEGKGPVRLAADIGWRRDPPHYGMLGMTIMAHLEPAEQQRLLREHPLRPLTRKSIIDPAGFDARLKEIAQQGYAVEFEEAIEGVWGVASPVRNSAREVVAAVGVALPMTVKTPGRITETITLVKSCAEAISADLGYRVRT